MSAFHIRPYTALDGDWVVARHGELYARTEGFDDSFGALVRQIIDAFDARPDPDLSRGWIGWRGAQRQGCVFVVPEAPGTAKLRLFLVEPESRGTGLAQSLLDHAIGFARETGHSRMRLWTHESFAAAGRIYHRNGFRIVKSTPSRSFGQDVVDQIWARDL